MYRKLLALEWKNFFRNPQFGTNLVIKILMFFGMLYFCLLFVAAPIILVAYAKDFNIDPVVLFCEYAIYYLGLDLVIRYFIQQMPTQNIKPLLTQNISKNKLVKYTIVKTFFHFFNWGNLLFLIPFGIMLIWEGYDILNVTMLIIGVLFLFYFNNFLNILLNGKNSIFYITTLILVVLGFLEYNNIIHLSVVSKAIFYSFYTIPGLFLISILLTSVLAYFAYKTIYTNFYLDKGLELKKIEGKTENIEFLNKFGVIGTFLNNDIRLLKRSKAAKASLVSGVMFLFYGLLFFNDMYQTDFMRLFAGLFVTGGFMMMFGQRVPAWDSSYYPLMMTQRVPYKQYLKAKWYLVVIAILISMVISTAYLYFGLEFYLTILAGGLYNLGVNSYLTLLGGAFNKQAVDLDSSAKSFGGGKNTFNFKVLLLMIPQFIVPMVIFTVMKFLLGINAAVISLAVLGAIGFLLRNYIFSIIVQIYKSEKYTTIQAYKKTI